MGPTICLTLVLTLTLVNARERDNTVIIFMLLLTWVSECHHKRSPLIPRRCLKRDHQKLIQMPTDLKLTRTLYYHLVETSQILFYPLSSWLFDFKQICCDWRFGFICRKVSNKQMHKNFQGSNWSIRQITKLIQRCSYQQSSQNFTSGASKPPWISICALNVFIWAFGSCIPVNDPIWEKNIICLNSMKIGISLSGFCFQIRLVRF